MSASAERTRRAESGGRCAVKVWPGPGGRGLDSAGRLDWTGSGGSRSRTEARVEHEMY